jgi:hypothetical protein
VTTGLTHDSQSSGLSAIGHLARLMVRSLTDKYDLSTYVFQIPNPLAIGDVAKMTDDWSFEDIYLVSL